MLYYILLYLLILLAKTVPAFKFIKIKELKAILEKKLTTIWGEVDYNLGKKLTTIWGEVDYNLGRLNLDIL